MPQLDGLRALAVGTVMLIHFYPTNIFLQHLPLGLGVDLFFVLSGFLITPILLQGKTVHFVLEFYIKRALRLFPLYYVAIGTLLLVCLEIGEAWQHYAFYGVNFRVLENRRWGYATHFWSLSVEEQFYILWPFAVILLSRRSLAVICFVELLLAPAFRLVAGWYLQTRFVDFLLPGCVDQLACGCLLALGYAPRAKSQWLIGTVAFLSVLATSLPAQFGTPIALLRSVALPFLWLLVDAARSNDMTGSIGRLLNNTVMRILDASRMAYT